MVEFEVLETPIKSESDKQNYRLLKLKENGIKILLISYSDMLKDQSNGNEIMDTDNEKQELMAQVAMCLSSGSFYDLEFKVPGIAHFVEHMIFMGSGKYPQENEFSKYINSYSGYSNAMTEYDFTLFFFGIVEEGLEGAVDRFVNLFVDPLMLKSSVDRERHAVDSEFNNNKDETSNRIEQILISMGQSHHPCSSFTWGNLKTLKDNISDDELYQKVHEFRKKYYTSDRMNFCFKSKQSLDELQELVLKYCCEIPKTENPQPLLSEIPEYGYKHAFTEDFSKKVYLVKPLGNEKRLEIKFILPPLVDKYRNQPSHFLHHLFNLEGNGTLAKYLRDKLLISQLGAYRNENSFLENSLFTILRIKIHLTDLGFEHIEKILDAIFSYLLLLKHSNSLAETFKEIKQIKDIKFKFRENTDGSVNELTANMMTYRPEDLITGKHLYYEYDENLIKSLIESLNDRNFNIMILSPTFEDFDQIEEWFGTEYKAIDFPESYKKIWENRSLKDDFALPEKNPFICSDFEIYTGPHTLYPEKIFENKYCEAWHRLDYTFYKPKGSVSLFLRSPMFVENVKNCALTALSLKIFYYENEAEVFTASSANYNVVLYDREDGISLQIRGYNQKLSLVADLFIRKFKNLSSSMKKSTFEICKDSLMKEYYKDSLQASDLNSDLRETLINTHKYTDLEKHDAMNKINFEDLLEFSDSWSKSLKIKFLFQGNILKDQAEKIVENVLEIFPQDEIDDLKIIKPKTRKFPVGKTYLKVNSLMPNSENSMVYNYYQFGEYSIKLQAIFDLFTLIIKEPTFNVLRTQQQLGYSVGANYRNDNKIFGLTFYVKTQENKHSLKEVDDQIENFIKVKISEILSNLSSEDFSKFKQSLIKRKSKLDIDLSTEIARNYQEIIKDEYIFDRREILIAALKALELQDIVDFYQNYFNGDSSVRKLSVQVVANKRDKAVDPIAVEILEAPENNDDGINFIENIEGFINSLELY